MICCQINSQMIIRSGLFLCFSFSDREDIPHLSLDLSLACFELGDHLWSFCVKLAFNLHSKFQDNYRSRFILRLSRLHQCHPHHHPNCLQDLRLNSLSLPILEITICLRVCLFCHGLPTKFIWFGDNFQVF